MLVRNDGPHFVAAPLLIWEWQLEPSQRRSDSWLVKHDQRHTVRPNGWLVRYLEANTEQKWRRAFQRVAQQPTPARLQELSDQIADQLSIDNRADLRYPGPFPGVERIGEVSKMGALLAAGVVGQYAPLSPGTSGADPSDAFHIEAQPQADDQHAHAPLRLDPYQRTAVQTALRNRTTLVTGPDGSGKDKVATWLLLNALSNGQRVLVVSDSVPALRKLQRELVREQGSAHHYLVRDPADDLPQLLQIYRSRLADRSVPPAPDADLLRKTIKQANRAYRRFDTAYAAARTPFFGKFTWSQTVGRYLVAERQASRTLLAEQLATDEFALTHEEYDRLCIAVDRCRPLYQRVNTMNHPLTALEDGIFSNMDAGESRRFIERQLERLTQETSDLLLTFDQLLDHYQSALQTWYQRFAERMRGQLDRWEERVQEEKILYGEALSQRVGWWQRISSPFSRPMRDRAQSLRDLRTQFDGWQRMHSDAALFSVSRHNADRGGELANMLSDAAAYREALTRWEARIPALVHNELELLNAQCAMEPLGYSAELTDLEQRYRTFQDRFNAAGLYQAGLERGATTIRGRRAELLRLRDRLAATRVELHNFRPFYNWQSVWLRQSATARRLLTAIIQVVPTDWRAALDSWYLYAYLERHFRKELPENAARTEELAATLDQLYPLLQADWMQQQHTRAQLADRKFRQANKDAYQAWTQEVDPLTAPVTDLVKLAHAAREAWRTVFPILFTTPTAARTLRGSKPTSSDLLICIGADRLTAREIVDFVPTAQRTVILASTPNDAANSLPHYLESIGAPTVRLDQVYREGRPVRPEATAGLPHPDIKITVADVGGRYVERENVNEIEAQEVISRLLQVAPTPQRVLPHVGVVCFTAEQRNLIHAYLLHVKQRNDPGSDKIRQLERNGLGIYTVDEVYGIPFDVLIVSFTFGRTNRGGDLGRSMAFFDRPESTRHFNYLLHRDVTELILINSLPDKVLRDYLHHAPDQGSFLFASYLLYYMARHDGDEATARSYLAHFAEDNEVVELYPTLCREVGEGLKPYLAEERIVYYDGTAEGAELLIHPRYEGEPTTWLQPEGFLGRAAYTDVHWELARQAELAEQGIAFQPVFTKKWWRQPAEAARRLASKLIKRDNQYERESRVE